MLKHVIIILILCLLNLICYSQSNSQKDLEVLIKEIENNRRARILQDILNKPTNYGFKNINDSSTINIIHQKNFISKPKIYKIRVGAVCNDGSKSGSTGRGTCSHHRGVRHWIIKTISEKKWRKMRGLPPKKPELKTAKDTFNWYMENMRKTHQFILKLKEKNELQ